MVLQMVRLALPFFLATLCFGQTTQGLLAGRILDARSGAPLEAAEVVARAASSGTGVTVRTDSAGYFAAAFLTPGFYRVRVRAHGYQAQEVHRIDLPVAGRVDVDFRLRPLSDVWEAGQYRSLLLPGTRTLVTFYGPDVDTSRSGTFDAAQAVRGALESTVSQVVEGPEIALLPLAGRDAYTMVVTQPGVTADTTTARSLGLSSNGQRPSASNFLLDGLENNNTLVSGPLTPIAPEAIAEYRISTNNFSAEFGRTSGYVANAVTRSGSNEWHGIGYFHLRNEALNANDFQSNARGRGRSPQKESQTGVWVGGPIRRGSLMVSGAYEYTRNRGTRTPATFQLPTERLLQLTAPDSIARQLLTRFPAPFVSGAGLSGLATLTPTLSVNRGSGLGRVDRIFSSGKHRLMGRVTSLDLDRPDFSWSPYPALTAGMRQRTTSGAATLSSALSPGISHELRVGYSHDRVALNRPFSEVPLLQLASATDATILPSNQISSTFDNRTRNWEVVDNLGWVTGRHFLSFGGGLLLRGLSGSLTAARDGQYAFASLQDFAIDRPVFFRAGLDRQFVPALRAPDFGREYRSNQYYLFAQDTYRATPRLSLNFGLRYESFGSPVNVGPAKDALVQLGPGNSIAERIAASYIEYASAGSQRLFSPDRNDWAARVGFSYRLIGADKLLVRAAFGTFYDRLYDNLWQNLRNNNVILPSAFTISDRATNYLMPVSDALARAQGQAVPVTMPTLPIKDQTARVPLTLFQPGFRTPYVQSYFLGFTSEVHPGWTVDLNVLGSTGRKLVTTDLVNRNGLNPDLGLISYRANQGTSSYNGMTALLRHRSRSAQFQAAYTWSHTIDNQSEVLRNDYYNLTPVRLTIAENRQDVSAFSRQFDSSVDRANSDFDQRHNFVFFSSFDLPAVNRSSFLRSVLRDWRVSQIAAFRSGFPYTVFAYGSPLDPIYNNRADMVDPDLAMSAGSGPTPVGGERLLSTAGFVRPTPRTLGNTGRNAFRGPGMYNIDASLSRSFSVPWLGEAGRLTFRADAFNLLNHTNLSLPDAQFGSSTFGIATYGRNSPQSAGVPLLTPVGDTARQIQLLLRLAF